MKNSFTLILLLTILFLTAACQATGEDKPEAVATLTFTAETALEEPESPTNTIEGPATDTPQPPTEEPTTTSTATPTETATPTGTATPEILPTETVKVTPDPEEGVGGILFDERFDGSSGWGWTYQEEGVVSFGIGTGGVLAAFEDANQGWRISLGPDAFSSGDQRTQLTARALNCGEQDEWGLLYRSEFTEDGLFNGYLFKINCAGQVQVERLDQNQGSVLLGWLPVESAETGAGGANTLMVWAAGEEMRFYVNDTYVDSVMDDAYESGEYGIYAQDRTNGDAEFLYIAMRVNQVAVE